MRLGLRLMIREDKKRRDPFGGLPRSSNLLRQVRRYEDDGGEAEVGMIERAMSEGRWKDQAEFYEGEVGRLKRELAAQATVIEGLRDQLATAQARITELEGAGPLRPAQPAVVRKGVEEKPWVKAGVSRATWFRRQKDVTG